MPELPEVETIRARLEPFLVNKTITKTHIRNPQLRWPIPKEIFELKNQKIIQLKRRGKYLLFDLTSGHLLIHLGMSGCLRLQKPKDDYQKHDHVEFILNNQLSLRFNDPRRFGTILWLNETPENHPLLAKLGPEPLSEIFNAEYLYQLIKHSKRQIKQILMDSYVVVGIGNIYANEALFRAGIIPSRSGDTLNLSACHNLVFAIKETLTAAIQQGGTTLRDYTTPEGKPGYFKQLLQVYGREGQPCYQCGIKIQSSRQNNRSTFFCDHCQY